MNSQKSKHAKRDKFRDSCKEYPNPYFDGLAFGKEVSKNKLGLCLILH